MHATTWANDPVNSPNHYTRSHPGMECIDLTADTSFCLGNAIKYLWRYHGKGRPVEDLEKARWYLCRVIDHDEKIAWTRQQHAILDTLANDPIIPDAEAHTWAKLRQGFPDLGSHLPRPPHRTRKEPTMTNPNTYNTACVTGVIDNVDFTLRDDSTSVTMLIPPDTPVGTRTIIIPQGFTLAEHRIIREAIADALADHGEEL
ncbi:MAG: DUF3310 domain-containing protein [Bifidobacterium longum]